MSERSDEVAAKPKRDPLKLALWGVAGIGVAGAVYIIAQAAINPQGQDDLKELAKGEMSKLTIPAEATVAPVQSFVDANGKTTRIADFKGKVTVVNIWATWCAPCVIEMPTLAKLAAEYKGQPVEIVAISIDKPEEADKAKAFIAKHAPLAFYQDPKMSMPFAVKPAAVGMPTTIIYGKDGMERARVSGEADWSGKDAKAVIDKVLAES